VELGSFHFDTESAGYKEIRMKPEVGHGITWAKGHYDSIRGRISSDWKIEEGVFHPRFRNGLVCHYTSFRCCLSGKCTLTKREMMKTSVENAVFDRGELWIKMGLILSD